MSTLPCTITSSSQTNPPSPGFLEHQADSSAGGLQSFACGADEHPTGETDSSAGELQSFACEADKHSPGEPDSSARELDGCAYEAAHSSAKETTYNAQGETVASKQNPPHLYPAARALHSSPRCFLAALYPAQQLPSLSFVYPSRPWLNEHLLLSEGQPRGPSRPR